MKSKHRIDQLSIPVTSKERAALRAAARTHGFRGVADYVRATAFAGKPATEHMYTVIVHPCDPDESGFWAEVPALPGCNSQGETYEETVKHAQEAIVGYLRMLLKTGQPIPREKQPKSAIVMAVKVAI